MTHVYNFNFIDIRYFVVLPIEKFEILETNIIKTNNLKWHLK